MKINSAYNKQIFGKKPILKCTLKRRDDQQKQNATLYLYDKKNPGDIDEVANLNFSPNFKRNFMSFFSSSYSKFYALKTDDTDEIAASCQVSKHFSPAFNSYNGVNTIIEEMDIDSNFVNSGFPLLAKIVSDSYDNDENFILTSCKTDELPDLNKFGFSQSGYDNWVMPQRRYIELIDKAEKRSLIEYLA